MPYRIYPAGDIARYFLAKTDSEVGDLISNLKLQKLCYYAQGIGLAARRGEAPMFNERIEAWLHGPVVPDLYHQYKDYKSEAIPPVADLDLTAYSVADRMILDDVYDYYGQYSAWRLRQMTHLESPWKDAYEEGESNVIEMNILADFFATQIADDYAGKYDQVQGG